METLAQQMFGDVFKGLKNAAGAAKDAISKAQEPEEDPAAVEAAKADAALSSLDARAQTGDVTFDDFLTMSSAFAGMGGKSIPGMPKLSEAQMLETKQKFERHSKIVEVMLDEERADPQLLMEDLKAGGSTPGPRIQRLATASGQPESEVGLFLMQFEAMRESTTRIAAGEDPDSVNESMAAAPVNRKARRLAQKKKDKAQKKKL